MKTKTYILEISPQKLYILLNAKRFCNFDRVKYLFLLHPNVPVIMLNLTKSQRHLSLPCDLRCRTVAIKRGFNCQIVG